MNSNKAIGLFILVLGLVIIFYGLYSSFNVFTGKNQPPLVFPLEKKSIEKTAKEFNSPEEMQTDLLKNVLSEKLEEMIPLSYFQKILNLIAFSIFIGILVFIGSNISGLGIKLLVSKYEK